MTAESVVVDASVAVRWTIEMPWSDRAEALIRSKLPLIAPEWIVAEVANAFLYAVRERTDRVQRALDGLEFLPRWFAALMPAMGLRHRAMACALELDHPVYDCFYLALAEKADCTYVTADERFLRKVKGTLYGRRVVHLKDWRE